MPTCKTRDEKRTPIAADINLTLYLRNGTVSWGWHRASNQFGTQSPCDGCAERPPRGATHSTNCSATLGDYEGRSDGWAVSKSNQKARFPVAAGAIIGIVLLCSCLGGASASAQLSPDLQLKGQANLI